MEQIYSSSNTSINKVSKIYTNMDFKENSFILDYGCGKYDTSIEYMKNKNCVVLPFDKYNRDNSINNQSLKYCENNKIDYIVCSNVLNVIKEEEIIDDILKHIHTLSKDNTIVYISVYEGNKTNIGIPTSKGYQRNEPYKNYLKYIEKYFNIEIKKQVFICRRK